MVEPSPRSPRTEAASAPADPASPPADTGSPTADKETLRRRFRVRRRELLPAAAPGILAACLRELPSLLPPGQRLGLYWPIGAEPDLRPLAAHWHGLRPDGLALPAVEPWPAGGPQLRLLYRPWRPGEPLAPDACRIPAPLPDPVQPRLDPAALALLLVPALAIDRGGVRLGSGGGWYDRLRSEPAWRRVQALAVLPAGCVREAPLPRDPWDVPFDGWIDETGLHAVQPERTSPPAPWAVPGAVPGAEQETPRNIAGS